MNKTKRNLFFIVVVSGFLMILSACSGDSENEQPLVIVTENIEATAVVEAAPTYTPVSSSSGFCVYLI